MNNIDLENLINFEEYAEFRMSNTQKDTMKHFNISRRNVLYLDDLLELDKEILANNGNKARAESYKRYWNNLSEEEKAIENAKNSERIKLAHINNPELAKNHSKFMKERYSDPEVRAEASRIQKQLKNILHMMKIERNYLKG